MQVFVDANFTLMGSFETPCKLFFTNPHITLKEFLKKIDALSDSINIIKEDELGDDVSEIWLNNKRFFSLNKKLNTILRDGDKVEIELYMAPLGGG